ncbi:hypothetical protein BDV96DRAFT_582885 [Lophiotrema nucula]|uniref:gluconokinase n=1 Tax=Lophiotrema nucula TaxID=690887 RepID=A0A6A5YW32_9PLEO|nr:hypothetical protein BDV96DRAFT_582885 [Lophiotrema nucula]
MAAGSPLLDQDRLPWLGRLSRRACETLNELGYERVIVSCSALKQLYRDQLRELNSKDVDVVFVALQCSKEVMVQRLLERKGHYMSVEMVEGQVEVYETAGDEETDVLPVDADGEKADVVAECEWLLDTWRELNA